MRRTNSPRFRPTPAKKFVVLATGMFWGLSLGAFENTPFDDHENVNLTSEFDCVVLPHAVIDVSSGVSGRIENIDVDRGDVVEKGQLLASLESGVEKANTALARERAAITSEIHLRATALEYDQRNQARSDSLYESNAITPFEKDQADKNTAMARWQLRQAEDKKRLAELELRRAEEILKLRSVTSPISGVVVERFKWAGEFVEEEPIVRVAQLDPLRVEVVLPISMHDVLSGDVVAKIVAETEPDNARAAKTTIIDPMADPASGTFRVALELPNLGHKLLGGIRCKARFALRETEPSEATDPAPAPLSLPPIVNSPLAPYPVDTRMTLTVSNDLLVSD